MRRSYLACALVFIAVPALSEDGGVQLPPPSAPPLVSAPTRPACGTAEWISEPSRQRPATPDEAAEDIWGSRCAMCHGANGDALTAMGLRHKARDFTEPQWQAAMSDEDIRCLIRLGVPGTPMRAFRHHLTDAQVEGLVRMIREFRSPHTAAAE